MDVETMMNLVILLVSFCGMEIKGIKKEELDGSKDLPMMERSWRTKRFFFYKANNINERSCDCPSLVSCNCCENVIILFMKAQKKLCANFMFQRNGLNVDISLDTQNVKSNTINNYRPMKICTPIPGSLFSLVCLNLLELNAFPKSLTVCPQFIIITKNQEWRIGYTCVSISTELPMVGAEVAGGTTIAMQLIMTTGRPMSGKLRDSPTRNQSIEGYSIDPSTSIEPMSSSERPINLQTPDSNPIESLDNSTNLHAESAGNVEDAIIPNNQKILENHQDLLNDRTQTSAESRIEFFEGANYSSLLTTSIDIDLY